MIGIIDYEICNIQSIYNALELLGVEAKIVKKPSELTKVKGIILPGVGAFGDAMDNLRRMNLIDALNKEVIKMKKPFLGICLGFQLIAEQSFEHGRFEGLGWVKGSVKKITPNGSEFKIPHMGWNDIKVKDDKNGTGLFKDFEKDAVMYFVHSYHLDAEEDVATSVCYHGMNFMSSIEKENIFGTQFHPEKSQGAGLRLLKNFSDIVNATSNGKGGKSA